MKILYPGSFNPWHAGHQYVYEFACNMVGKENVIVGVAQNSNKTSVSAQFLAWSISPTGATVKVINGAVADYCVSNGIEYMIRGIRPSYDLPQEASLDWWNKRISKGKVQTFFVMTPSGMDHISSSAIRTAIDLGHEESIESVMTPLILSRWKVGDIPSKYIFFGRSSIGKTTFLKNSKFNAINCDTRIWEIIYDKSFKTYARRIIFDAIEQRSMTALERAFRIISDRVDWVKLFDPLYSFCYDAAALGSYFKYIPQEVLSNFQLIKLSLKDDKERMRRATEKGFQHKLEDLDWMYRDPDFWDETLELK